MLYVKGEDTSYLKDRKNDIEMWYVGSTVGASNGLLVHIGPVLY
jgi:hypothetical protein